MEKIITKPGFEPILEKIFMHFDSQFLMKCLSSVCKYWNQVVQNPSFLMKQLKFGKMPEDKLKKWKELAIVLQNDDNLIHDFSRCMFWALNEYKANGFLYPETAASALGLVPLLQFIESCTKIDFSGEANNGSSALHYAAENGQLEVFKFLATFIEKNANIENKYKCTPIHYGAISGKVEIMKYFHYLGYDLNIPTDGHWTPFLLAVYFSHIEVIKFLASIIENPLSKLFHGRTAFHLAAEYGRQESLKCLLKIFGSRLVNEPILINFDQL